MAKLWLLLALTAIIATAVIAKNVDTSDVDIGDIDPEDLEQIEGFFKKHNKIHKDKKEKVKRVKILKEKLKRIRDHNSKNGSWKKALNFYSDLSDEEHMERCGRKPSPKQNATTTTTPDATVPESRASPPPTWDIRTMGPGKITPVKDQKQCGSCWAFATIGALENAWSIKSGSLYNLTEQQLVDCSTQNSGCNGGFEGYAFNYAKNGIGLGTSYPYTAIKGTCKTVSKVASDTGYVNLPADANAIKTRLSTNGACTVCVDARNMQQYSSGIFTGASSVPECNHAVLLVGYGTGYWLIKNSWGTSWGQKGYIQVSTALSGGLFLNEVFCPTM